jgi:hypothetical protein
MTSLPQHQMVFVSYAALCADHQPHLHFVRCQSTTSDPLALFDPWAHQGVLKHREIICSNLCAGLPHPVWIHGHPTMAAPLPLMAVGGVCGYPHQDGSQNRRLLSRTVHFNYLRQRCSIGGCLAL